MPARPGLLRAQKTRRPGPLRRIAVSGWFLAIVTIVMAIVVPAFAYAVIDSALPGTLPLLQYVVATAYALTAMMTLLEARAALGTRDEPRVPDVDDPAQLEELPSVTAIVSAYLPNERELVADTIVHLATEMKVAPGKLQIILAYNTPDSIPDVEEVLASLAELNVGFMALRVPSSTSKSENVNAAMGFITGDVTLLLDADHRPDREAAVRALRWFQSGYDIVQGRCVIREHDTNWLSRIIAVEFEQIYAVSHAGRSLAFDTAMFCGTNGWWRTSVLRQIGMDDQMLTEDIDSSVRALLAGHRTIHDRSVISTELAPPTPRAWWGQRMRWAQGWFQVTLRHQAAIVRSPVLTSRLKIYWSYLLGWRELFPVLSLQIFALLLATVLVGRSFSWFYDPYLVLTTVLTLIAGPLAAIMTYKVALESQRRELRPWFYAYAFGSLFYTTAKNTVAMVATVRELLGQRGWIVTKRATGPTPKVGPTATAPSSAPARITGTAVVALVAGVAAFGALKPSSAQAQTSTPPTEITTLKVAPFASSTAMTGRAPVTGISVPIPADWKRLGGTFRLHWQGSPELKPNSTLQVRVNGVLRTAVPVKAGPGSVDVRIPASDVPADHRVAIELRGQFHTRIDATCCNTDPATGAILTIDRARSTLRIAGTRNSTAPLLADLPGSLVDVTGKTSTRLFLALPDSPSADTVRAASVMAAAVARASGSTSVPIEIVSAATPSELDGLPGQVVVVDPTGRPRIAVRRRPDGRLIATVGGSGDGVVRAAWSIARERRGFQAGSESPVSGGLPDTASKDSTTRATITPASGEGTGRMKFNVGFRLPEDRELVDRKISIDLGVGFSAPAGGRVSVGLNGQQLLTRNLPSQGTGQSRFKVDVFQDTVDAPDAKFALGVLTLPAGDNFMTIEGDLPPGQPVGNSGDALPPAVQILPSSVVTFKSRPRPRRSLLDLWPWPFTTTDAMTGTTVVLGSDPTPSELSWAITTIAEASRFTDKPLAPKFAIAPRTLPDGDVVVLARGTTPPVALPSGAPVPAREALLETWSQDGRQILLANGVRALRPLGSAYYTNKVKGQAAVIAADGKPTTLKGAEPEQAFKKEPLAWKVPAAVLTAAILLLLFLRIRSVRRRLDDLQPPTPAQPFDEAGAKAQLEEWQRLVAADENGARARNTPAGS
ncbi:cellulose biosynthesis cyclic di-GMP-binding regulatory protein BcsB [Patulibacter sp. NPDC049589]|uniref:cellulose biosynthesis cyclic di-GMP-binding regulatory protein BcsB n=1 Tax=Patulibacter sp. NPDC049589 TaxID=3154731 RepID=UPI0034181B79